MKNVFAAVLVSCFFILGGCGEEGNGYQGYVDVEYTNLSTQTSGTITAISALKGARVHTNDLLLQLDDTQETLLLAQLNAQLEGAKNILADMQTGKRALEQEIIQAQLNEAQATLQNASNEYERYKNLYTHQSVSSSMYEAKETAYKTALSRVQSVQYQLSLAKEGNRAFQIKAQQNAIDQIEAKIKEAQYQRTLKRIAAPAEGTVFDVYYHTGEFLAAGHVALRLIEPGQIKARFFVPTGIAAHLKVGQKVGIETGEQILTGEITYISPTSEYTPPVIYSNESNKRLVFMVEAKPELKEAQHLLVGQPLKVHIDVAR